MRTAKKILIGVEIAAGVAATYIGSVLGYNASVGREVYNGELPLKNGQTIEAKYEEGVSEGLFPPEKMNRMKVIGANGDVMIFKDYDQNIKLEKGESKVTPSLEYVSINGKEYFKSDAEGPTVYNGNTKQTFEQADKIYNTLLGKIKETTKDDPTTKTLDSVLDSLTPKPAEPVVPAK